jgi:hypothetical protein
MRVTMNPDRCSLLVVMVLLVASGVTSSVMGNGPLVRAQHKNRVLEIRTYTAQPGRLGYKATPWDL